MRDGFSGVRLIAVLVVLFMALAPTPFIYGPRVEAWLFPVLDISAVDVRTELTENGDGTSRPLMCFKTEVHKHRPCLLDVFSFRWLFDHSVEVTPVIVRETGMVFQPQSVVTTGKFTSRDLCTDIPLAAYGFKQVQFRGTTYFVCHALWPLSYDFTIPIDIPPLTPENSQCADESCGPASERQLSQSSAAQAPLLETWATSLRRRFSTSPAEVMSTRR